MNNSIAYKLTQLPTTFLAVGVDPHKHQHTIVVRTSHARVLSKFKIVNDRAGFEELRRRCEQFRQQTGITQVIFAIEPSGHYWRNLGYFLQEHGETFRLVNPLTLKRQRDGDDLTHRKTDYRDAEKAAELLTEGKYTWTHLATGKYAELRQAYETYQQLVEETARTKVQLTTALDGLFPEFRQVFKSLEGSTALTILRTCPNPFVIATLSADEFCQRLRTQHGRRRLSVAKVRALHRRAASSVGLRACADALTLQVQLLAERLQVLLEQRQHAEAYLTTVFLRCDESRYLLSIRGLGIVNAAGLLAHLGDIQHYSRVKQWAKLAGVNPQENCSADRRSAHTPMSKKGRRRLRSVLWRAVIALLRHNAAFQGYVRRLTERPAHAHPLTKREAIGAAMNKLLRIVYALLRQRVMFDPAKAFGV